MILPLCSEVVGHIWHARRDEGDRYMSAEAAVDRVQPRFSPNQRNDREEPKCRRCTVEAEVRDTAWMIGYSSVVPSSLS